MNKDERKRLIKSLLSGRLSKQRRKEYADLDSVDKELKSQWDESGNKMVDMKIKEQIWKKVKSRCENNKSGKVHVEPMWYFVAASITLLFTIGGIWFGMTGDQLTDELIEVAAHQNRMYVLPDSTKVWMDAGSTIKYSKAFAKNRKVWLEGNSLFEVTKQKENTFKVYIDKAFIEVKGTCFLVKQSNAKRNEITLFNGKIEFNVKSTGEKTIMKPMQRVIYNPAKAETKIEKVANIKWENGKYNFTDIPLQELINTINDKYSSNITLAKDINQESAFTGSIRYDEPLEDVIEKICFSLNLTKEVHENGITIKI